MFIEKYENCPDCARELSQAEYDFQQCNDCRSGMGFIKKEDEEVKTDLENRAGAPAQSVDSTGDARTVNNVVRHEYRVLSDGEKAAMKRLKDDGLAMHEFLAALGDSEEIRQAQLRVREAVMWGVNHITK